ncbi:MAG: hypothetical protein H7A41_00600 [Chlamydiales bacterium]|nr:hypothetical protein [Chlamydiales bacterium]
MSMTTTGFQPHIIEDYIPKKAAESGDLDELVSSFVSIDPVIRSEIREVTEEVTKQVYIGVWGMLGYTTAVVEKQIIGEETVVLYPAFEKDKEAIQQELTPFFDEPEKITYEDVQEYISALNETYPEYAIDERRGLLSEIRRTKNGMIERGERGFVRGVGLYSCFSESGRNTMLKIAAYQKNRSQISEDIGYQREMLSWFKFFHGCSG